MTNSTIKRTKTFCIRIVDFRASRGFKFQNFPGLRPCPIGGLTAPPKPPAAYSLASLGRFASLRSDISVGKYPLLTTIPDKLYWHFLPKKRKIPYYTFTKCLVFLPILMLGENPQIRAPSYISPLILPQLDNSGTNFLFEPKA